MNSGQVMLLTVLALSGTILGATTIAGLLMLYQIRQSTDASNSTKAIYAADAGIEWELYRFFQEPNYPKPTFANQSDFDITCSSTLTTEPGGATIETVVIKSTGKAANNSRAFEITFAREVFEATSFCTP